MPRSRIPGYACSNENRSHPSTFQLADGDDSEMYVRQRNVWRDNKPILLFLRCDQSFIAAGCFIKLVRSAVAWRR